MTCWSSGEIRTWRHETVIDWKKGSRTGAEAQAYSSCFMAGLILATCSSALETKGAFASNRGRRAAGLSVPPVKDRF